MKPEISFQENKMQYMLWYCILAAENIFCLVCTVAQLCPTLCDTMDGSPQAPLSISVSRQRYWSEMPFPSPGDLPYPGIEPKSPALQADSLPSEPPGKSISIYTIYLWVYELIYHEGFGQEGRWCLNWTSNAPSAKELLTVNVMH